MRKPLIFGTLLIAGLCFSAGAHAQATYSINGSATGVQVSSTNSGAVTIGDTITGTTSISAGATGKIGSTAVGASSSGGINVNYETATGYQAGGVDTYTANLLGGSTAAGIQATNNAGGTISATLSVASPSISGGVGGQIGTTAVGASAAGAINVNVAK